MCPGRTGVPVPPFLCPAGKEELILGVLFLFHLLLIVGRCRGVLVVRVSLLRLLGGFLDGVVDRLGVGVAVVVEGFEKSNEFFVHVANLQGRGHAESAPFEHLVGECGVKNPTARATGAWRGRWGVDKREASSFWEAVQVVNRRLVVLEHSLL